MTTAWGHMERILSSEAFCCLLVWVEKRQGGRLSRVLQVLAWVLGQCRAPDPTNDLRGGSCHMLVPRHRPIRSEGLGLSQVSSDLVLETQWLCDSGWFIHLLRSQRTPVPPEACISRGWLGGGHGGGDSLSLGSIRPFPALSSHRGFPSKGTGNCHCVLFIC